MAVLEAPVEWLDARIARRSRLMLEGGIAARGVVRPVTAEFYRPILGELEEHGIVCQETTDWTEQVPGHEGGE
ncbi:hypothetical protein HGA89_02695 [bacterium]|nr:hypothetical protein [bacterium]